MNKHLAIAILIILVRLGIGRYLHLGHSSSKPLPPTITVGKKKVTVAQGSYCWKGFFNGKCVDMASPPEIIKSNGLKPVVVSPETQLKIKFNKVRRECI